MLNQCMAEDELRRLRKEDKLEEACRKGQLYNKFFPTSNSIKEELSLSYFIDGNYKESLAWFKTIDLTIEPSYIAKDMKPRLEHNHRLLMNAMDEDNEIPMISVVINATHKLIDEVFFMIDTIREKCQDGEMVHLWVVLVDNSIALEVMQNAKNITYKKKITILGHEFGEKIVVNTPFVLYAEVVPSVYFQVIPLMLILSSDILVSHVVVQKELQTEIQTKNIQNKIFFSHRDMFYQLLQKGESQDGYIIARTGHVEGNIQHYIKQESLAPISVPRFKSFMINLDRRTDRLEKMSKQFKHLPDIIRISACDGRNLKPSSRLQALCTNTNYDMSPGVIACALSHLKIFRMLIEDQDVDGYLIFEDDVVVNTNFIDQLHRVLSITQDRNREIIFLSSVPLQCRRTLCSRYQKTGILDRESYHWNEIAGGTGCYYITKNMAKNVLDYIDQRGLISPIDMILMFTTSRDFKPTFCLPPIVNQYDVDSQSDVQNYQHPINLQTTDNPSPYKIFGPTGHPDFIEEIME